jgi:hypothetical protein
MPCLLLTVAAYHIGILSKMHLNKQYKSNVEFVQYFAFGRTQKEVYVKFYFTARAVFLDKGMLDKGIILC